MDLGVAGVSKAIKRAESVFSRDYISNRNQ